MASMRDLTAAEAARVAGAEWSSEDFLASVESGAAIGAAIGGSLATGIWSVFGAFYGGLSGGALGGAYYGVGELIDYCY